MAMIRAASGLSVLEASTPFGNPFWFRAVPPAICMASVSPSIPVHFGFFGSSVRAFWSSSTERCGSRGRKKLAALESTCGDTSGLPTCRSQALATAIVHLSRITPGRDGFAQDRCRGLVPHHPQDVSEARLFGCRILAGQAEILANQVSANIDLLGLPLQLGFPLGSERSRTLSQEDRPHQERNKDSTRLLGHDSHDSNILAGR